MILSNNPSINIRKSNCMWKSVWKVTNYRLLAHIDKQLKKEIGLHVSLYNDINMLYKTSSTE
jgi:hypothetical protein